VKTNLLSALAVKNATSNGKAVHKHPDGGGLYLFAYSDGSKYWRVRYWVAGKEKLLSVGTWPTVTLAEAREKRDKLQKQLADGIDPGVQRKADKVAAALSAANTFEAVAREWYDNQLHTWVESHAVDVRRRLEANIYPALGKRPIADLKAPEILAAVRKIEERGSTDLAHRVMGVVGQVLRYGVATGRGERDHTADLRGALTPHKKGQQAAVGSKELPQLLRDIAAYDQPPVSGEKQTRIALQVLALTFTRTSELIGATWGELDLDAPYDPEHGKFGPMWCIPGVRMKGGKDHMVPLAPQSVKLFKELKVLAGESDYVLPGRKPVKPISNNTLLFGLYRLGYRGRQTGHGFRAIASTHLHEKNLFEPDWIERQLAHVPANQVAAAYNRAKYLPQRADMMRYWADYLDEQVLKV
jgi:integrase